MFQTYMQVLFPRPTLSCHHLVHPYLVQMSPLMFSKVQLIVNLLMLTSSASIDKSFEKLIF